MSFRGRHRSSIVSVVNIVYVYCDDMLSLLLQLCTYYLSVYADILCLQLIN